MRSGIPIICGLILAVGFSLLVWAALFLLLSLI